MEWHYNEILNDLILKEKKKLLKKRDIELLRIEAEKIDNKIGCLGDFSNLILKKYGSIIRTLQNNMDNTSEEQKMMFKPIYIFQMKRMLKSFMSFEFNKLNTKINNKINYRENKKNKIANGEIINRVGRPWKKINTTQQYNKMNPTANFNTDDYDTLMNASHAIYKTATEYNYDQMAEYNTNTIEIF